MNNRLLRFLIFVSLMASTSYVAPTLASDRCPGVIEGQFLHYEGDVIVTSNDAEFMSKVNFSDYYTKINITVLQVLGENITYKKSVYTNLTGTPDLNVTVKLNVETGYSNASYPGYSMLFVSANLSVGDSIYVGVTNMAINETIDANYLGLQLRANHCYTETNATNAEVAGLLFNFTARSDYYWDKATGVLLEITGDIYYTRSDGVDGLFVTHIRSQILMLLAIPLIPELHSFLILPLFIIATLLTVIVCRKQEFKK